MSSYIQLATDKYGSTGSNQNYVGTYRIPI